MEVVGQELVFLGSFSGYKECESGQVALQAMEGEGTTKEWKR